MVRSQKLEPVTPSGPRWTREELMRELGIGPERLVRYRRAGIVGPPQRAGALLCYDAVARMRLKAALTLRARGLSPQAIVERFKSATAADFRGWTGEPVPAGAVAAPPPPVPVSPPGSKLWARIPVAPGIEVHVDLSVASKAKLPQLVKAIAAALR